MSVVGQQNKKTKKRRREVEDEDEDGEQERVSTTNEYEYEYEYDEATTERAQPLRQSKLLRQFASRERLWNLLASALLFRWLFEKVFCCCVDWTRARASRRVCVLLITIHACAARTHRLQCVLQVH